MRDPRRLTWRDVLRYVKASRATVRKFMRYLPLIGMLVPVTIAAQTTAPGGSTPQLPPFTPAKKAPLTVKPVPFVPRCAVEPGSARAYLYSPLQIRAGYTVTNTQGVVLSEADNAIRILFPKRTDYADSGYAGIHLVLDGSQHTWLLPFNELYLNFSVAELEAHGVPIWRSNQNVAVCYIRVRTPLGYLLSGTGGSSSVRYYEIANFDLRQSFSPYIRDLDGYHYDIEVFEFVASSLTKRAEFRISFGGCPPSGEPWCVGY